MPRSRSRSPVNLPEGVSEIGDNDYFKKSDEFRVWLKEEKGKYFDELSGEKARSYFHKFVKAWNRGKISRHLYAGIDSSTRPSASSTAYKWTFATGEHSRVSARELAAARVAVSQDTQGADGPSGSARVLGPAPPRVIGPSLPSSSGDRQLKREMDDEDTEKARRASRKRQRADEKDRIEDMVGPKDVGREGMLEKKRARREGDKTFREKSAGAEIPDDVLMGGDSFQARLAQRDTARKRFEDKRAGLREEKEAAVRERQQKLREKNDATMDMFKALAKERFG